jgi:tetratricopeptide (TPR) repeat protein
VPFPMRRRKRSSRFLSVAAAALAAALATAAARAAPTAPTSPIARYYAELQRLGVVDPRTGAQDTLREELGVAEAALERSDLGAATAALYGVVESPRFADFSDSVGFQNAEYDLVVALVAAGAYNEAVGYADRILLRGVKAPYFAVAHRRAVDVALATREYGAMLGHLEGLKIAGELPAETVAERTYLRGRAAYENGKLEDAELALSAVSRKSRLYTSAVYLRGVIRVRQGKLSDAVDAFCEIAQTPDDDRYTFFIDDRYYGLKDLARLGAGRLDHELGRYDDAYYHYFQIPDDSDRLPEALFEAAWSMYQKRELTTARQLVKEFLDKFPTAPLRTEGLLLAAYIALADCRFDEADRRFEELAADVRPLLQMVETAQASLSTRQLLLVRALERVTPRGPAAGAPALSKSPEDRVLVMLRLDPRLVRLNDAVAGLKREAVLSAYAIDAWRQLLTRLAGAKGQVATAPGPTPPTSNEAQRAARLLADVRRLRDDARRERSALLGAVRERRVSSEEAAHRLPELDRVEADLAALETKAYAASGKADERLASDADPALRAIFADELARAEKLSARTADLTQRFDKTSDEVALRELARVHALLKRFLEKARLGKVDAVIGQKRRLEQDIEDIARDNYVPPELAKAFKNNLIGDDEEYWPQEEEVWKDEFEGWR